MYERDAGPAWLVFDQNHRNRHLFTLDVPGFWYAPGAVIPACRQRLLTGHGPQLRGGGLDPEAGDDVRPPWRPTTSEAAIQGCAGGRSPGAQGCRPAASPPARRGGP